MIAFPETMPVITPEASTVTVAASLVVHVPPGVLFDNVVELPGHTDVIPVVNPIEGVVFTVSDTVAYAVPQLLVTA